jgi:hypothetical protein
MLAHYILALPLERSVLPSTCQFPILFECICSQCFCHEVCSLGLGLDLDQFYLIGLEFASKPVILHCIVF